MNIDATFVRSAAAAGDLPRDGLAEIALVGRSNVGKSSLINALVRRQIARTSAAPGKTRLANLYRVVRGSGEPFYLVDLPGYGFARRGPNDFGTLAAEYFDEAVRSPEGSRSPAHGARRVREGASASVAKARVNRERAETGGVDRTISALLLVDARHPGLDSDVNAWRWLRGTVQRVAVVATKTDKLARGERIRSLRAFESVFEDSVLPVSAVTGEGLDELWKVIEQLRRRNNNQPRPAKSSNKEQNGQPRGSSRPRAATDRPPLPRRRS